ncbi:MAG TPA: DUF455 family protein, partial [Myxococcota bacterium]|nr:DUF455 family protein [Myxococcota bacterium]
LRFPDAPPAFRRGLAQTLQEEQLHFRLYLERMQLFGVSFGEVPVNDFFWRCVADMAAPVDFVRRMSLVFEQANLDFARHYRDRFAEAGDPETAKILHKVLEDEEGHVRLGLHWFRAWKPPGQSDWDFFVEGLEEPLGPSRAKGPIFQGDLRKRLGFDEEFVEKLSLWARSRGRPPLVWAMNASAESQVARNSPGYTPPLQLQELDEDLAGQLLFLAAREDVVLLPRSPSLAWLRSLRDANVPLPETVSSVAELEGRKLSGLCPWGQSPDMARLEERLAPACVTPPSARWGPGWREAYGKDLAVQLRRRLPSEAWLAPPWGEVCHSLADVEALGARGGEIFVKARFKSSGRDALRLRPGQRCTEAQIRWLERLFREQGSVVVEPWCRRRLDLSFHYDLGERASFQGICRFFTTEDGRFAGATVGPWQEDIDADLRRFLHGEGKDPRRMRRVAEEIGKLLEEALLPRGVRGPVGVDAFVYEDAEGLHLQPLLEINPRWTMGRLALRLGARVHSGSKARLELLPLKDPLPPPEMSLRDGLWEQGVIYTTDYEKCRRIVGRVRVERRA